jgi:hypothetical protein
MQGLPDHQAPIPASHLKKEEVLEKIQKYTLFGKLKRCSLAA